MIVVDESGSMQVIREQALVGMNETIETIVKMQKLHEDIEQRLTLLTFDTGHTTFHFDNAPASRVGPLNRSEYNPGGGTPLYDAIGLGIAKINAICDEEDSVLVTIITDGEENSSREYNLRMIKNLIEKLKKHNWTFTLIGTDNLDVEGIAGSMGIKNHMEFHQDVEGTKAMFERERKARGKFYGRRLKGLPEIEGAFFAD